VYQITANSTFIVAGGNHTCLIKTVINQTSLSCWGRNNYGQIGNSDTTDVIAPLSVPVIGRELTSLTAGTNHTCAKRTSYGVYCWGRNDQGQLGIGNTVDATSPTLISSTSFFSSLSGGVAHTCGIKGNYAYCWGDNNNGQIGNGNTTDVTVPTKVN
jgi:alpha-tubulin suppressor-like RCC1 family protein